VVSYPLSRMDEQADSSAQTGPAVGSPSDVPDEPGHLEPALTEPGERDAQPAVIPNPSALIFDLDGTLVDTVQQRIEAWMRTFDEVGISADRQHVSGMIGADGKRLAMEVAAVADRRLSDERADAVDRRAGEIFSELNTDPHPVPGAAELLRSLDEAGLPWSVATSSRREQAGRSIAALGLASEPRVADGQHVEHAKPAPDLLLYAAAQLDVPTHRCWCIGDSVWDMRAARAAGMVAVGVASGAASMETLRSAGAHLAVASLEQLRMELVTRGVLAGP
jgi:HAD superfamily hydrolase (TIGR01509 family)